MPFRFPHATCAGLFALAALVFGVPPAAYAAPPLRIVSLMPSLTEDLFAIGAGPDVVGVSAYTDYPAAAAKLPVVASFTSLDAERVVKMHPDIVLGIPGQSHLVADLVRAGVRVELIDDESYDQIFTSLARVGTLTGHEREASALAARLRARTAALTRRLPADRPRTFVVLETNPIVTTGDGSYIARLISLAGGVNAAGNLSEAYPRYSAEALLARAPDAIVADRLCGLQNVLGTPPWNALGAVRDGHVYILGDADILERPGPRYNEGLAWLIARLHGHAQGR
ncbi:MAG: ABC transporter substrate-binding protein [Candidatus Eremiobacteraeota bacterium]|nr:ABC transporter substrate-binding protein [Candidatus Eremiobacteraeota bacterium]